MSYSAPFTLFTRVAGKYGTLAPFFNTRGYQQSITGGGDISLDCYHTKIYTTSDPVTFRLASGLQDGFLKKITFCFKGSDQATAVVECPGLTEYYSRIVFTEPGDQLLLIWDGGAWRILETLNITDPSLNSPTVD